MQTAEFAVVKGSDHEPVFNRWVKNVLMKRDKIIARKRTHKFGIELPKTVNQAHARDAKNGNIL